MDDAAYDREQARHDREGHGHAEYPDACYICQEQGREGDGNQRIELNHNPARPNRWGWATTPLVAIHV